MRYAAYSGNGTESLKKSGADTMKVVIIDDKKETADRLQEQLVQHQIEIVGRGDDGKAAVQLCNLLDPDFLLYGMDELEFDLQQTIETIKQKNPKTKFILCTDYEINFKVAVFAICKKPYDISEIVQAIKNA